MIWLTAPLIVLGGVMFAALVIYLTAEPANRSVRDRPAPEHNPMRICKGCGDVYHESWGRICPNCSGAD